MGYEDNIRRVVPYTPGEQPKEKNIIKLNTNENPYPPSEKVKKAIRDFDPDSLRLYPDPKCSKLNRALADYYGVDEDMVFSGVGSDDVIDVIFTTFFYGKDPVLFPDITYSFYNVWADLLRIPYTEIPLDDDLLIKKEDYIGKKCGGIVIANPNAPTGVLLPLSDIEDIVKANRDVCVVIDEAYIDFGGESALPLVRKYDNVIVVRTYSKSRSLAGFRIGYAIADKKMIRYLNDVKYSINSYTMNNMVLDAGVAAIEDDEYFKETVSKIIKTREYLKEELEKLGFTCPVSKTNFLFVKHDKKKATEIFEYLKDNNVYVRHFNKPERINDYLRISIGTNEEVMRLLALLKDFVV